MFVYVAAPSTATFETTGCERSIVVPERLPEMIPSPHEDCDSGNSIPPLSSV